MPEIVGKQIGPIAFGMMGLTLPPQPVEQCFEAMRAALDAGCNFWNAGTLYGTPDWNSITLLVAYFKKYPEDASKIVLSVKGAYDASAARGIGSPEGVKKDLDKVLHDLKGLKNVDVFECARVDPEVPIETTLKFLEDEYVSKGLIGGIALSEVTAATIRRAAKVTKIVAVENELSIWCTDILENGAAAACAELNIPLLAYSPIGKGMLSGEFKTYDDIPEGDFRHMFPRFQRSTFPINVQLVNEVCTLAAKKGCTPAQLAINWTRAVSEKPGMPLIIPIPGSSKQNRVRENALVASLTGEELDAIDSIMAKFTVVGGRYPDGWPIEG